MNEKDILSNHSISVRIGNSVKFVDLDIFTALCDRFLYKEIIDIVAQSPTDKIFYSLFQNQTKCVLQIVPNNP